MAWFENYDLEKIVTPVDPFKLRNLLRESHYDSDKTEFLFKGFTEGFDLGYNNEDEVRQLSPNLKITIGSEVELWNKVMKEVELKRYAGPFEKIPYSHDFIQSPIGLVPKDGGTKTRLIFHLSYPRNGNTSVNYNTDDDLIHVSYPDFDSAIRICLREGKGCKIAKSDLSSAFRHLCIHKRFWRYLIMKAKCLLNGRTFYFVDKCLPFGASISCALFQELSNAISHLVEFRTKKENINYLDDFFFAHIKTWFCNRQVEIFLQVCNEINFPVSMDKTFWGTTQLTFLGLLIDTVRQQISVPLDKIQKAVQMIHYVLDKPSKKLRLEQLQKLCGFLNFLCKAIVPGRAFTRRLYSFGAGLTKKNHHLKIKGEMKSDLRLWLTFLSSPRNFSHPFFHFNQLLTATDIHFMTDASKNKDFGCGGVCGTDWFIMQWETGFIKKYDPSIAFLELFALTVGILAWIRQFKNMKLVLFCDNMSVVHMINTTSSSCKFCMKLIRIIVLELIQSNTHVTCRHIPTKQNIFADNLSRMRYDKFRLEGRKRGIKFNGRMTEIQEILLPIEKFFK